MNHKLPNTAAYDPSSTLYYLTLRYNPLLAPTLPRIHSSDMRPLHTTPPSLSVLQDMIVKSMRLSLCGVNSDVKVALALSGGVDSTLMLALLRRYFPNLDVLAITIRFDGAYDESAHAARTAEALGADHIIVDVDNPLQDLPAAIHTVSLPMWDLHVYNVVKEASAQSADILVSGDGGDELFGGYTFRYKNFLNVITSYDVDTITPDQKIHAYLNNHIRDFVDEQNDLFDSRMNFSWKNIYDILYPYFDNKLESLEQVFLADYNGKMLYNFSQIVKPLSSHFGVKIVAPLLSPQIIKYAMKIKPEQKYDNVNEIGKLPLRSILGILDAEHLTSDEKAGFSPNTVSYWHKYGYDICSTYLSTAKIIRDGWISKRWVESHLRRDLTDVRYINKFLGLLAFEIWYKIFITKEIEPNIQLT